MSGVIRVVQRDGSEETAPVGASPGQEPAASASQASQAPTTPPSAGQAAPTPADSAKQAGQESTPAAQARHSGAPAGQSARPGAPKRIARPHPYADEKSTPEELAYDPKRVAAFWLGLATALTVIGLGLARLYSPHVPGATMFWGWDAWTQLPLFAGLGLLGFGFVSQPWAKRVTLLGWLLFAFYWALVAQDLFYAAQMDYVNMVFAVLGAYFFTYLAYHQWLSQVRRVESRTVHFLNVSTFVAAGSYFLIDKIEPIRRWLILVVSDHTHWMLTLFGQGAQNGLVYTVNPNGSTSDFNANLALFWYEDHLHTTPVPGDSWFSQFMHFDPGTGSALILPVSIILACTALQSIMLFVGLFMGTPASLKKRLWASAVVAVVVYVLNLVRNTGIVWFYGQGEASFWMMHDVVGKGGSLVAMIAIAFAAFAWFPEFLRALIGVLDLPYRDGPLERGLRIGRRRPEPTTA
jgi:archaeosortase A (PGF-CTERM-specific)